MDSLPEDKIVELLESAEAYYNKTTEIKSIIESGFGDTSRFDIRKRIYDAYAAYHLHTEKFDLKRIKQQNVFLESVLSRCPFALEYAHTITLGIELGTPTTKEFDSHEAMAEMALRCIVWCLREHEFRRPHATTALEHWKKTTDGVLINSSRMRYLEHLISTEMV